MRDVEVAPRAPLELPGHYTSAGAGADPGAWWTSFEDPELGRLIERALEHNLGLRQAWARLEQARALEKAATAGLFPRLDATTSAGYSKSPPREFSFGGQQQEVPGVESASYNASLPVSYEVDVWGRVRAGMFAAEQDVVAARADVEAVAMTVAASVTERWLDVVTERALAELLRGQVLVNKSHLELVELRFVSSDAALSDVLQQRQQIQALEAELATVLGRLRAAEHQLTLLLGAATPAPVARTVLPGVPPLPPTGVPASLVERRPDVRAARARVVAADYRIAQAIAARLPTLTLSGSIGLSSPSLSSFFESFVWSTLASATGTLFDGGRLEAEIDRSEAVMDERVASYGERLLTALVEVESALALERARGERIAILAAGLATAQETLEAARVRFAAGVGSYLSVLTALRSLQQTEQQLLGARRALLSERVQVYRALGSRWTEDLKAPKKPDDDEERGS
jgi:NodT family efflux transporter outer membrane factor (OMF) lipoprotein